MANFNASGPVIALEILGSSLSVAALPLTTTREARRRSAGTTVLLNEDSFALPTSGQIWPLGLA